MEMIPEWAHEILSPSQFIPHGHCYLWQPELVWLHVLADGLIAIAYFSIPVMLFYFVRKREDVPFPGIFVLFALFIVTCGTTHLMSIWTLWHPAYWLAGVIKSITAVVSTYTALTLFPALPVALALPNPETLRRINLQLATEIEERTQAEAELKRLNQELERRVEERTASLKESEQRFRSLFESAPDFVYVLNQQGLIQQVNSTVLARSGYTESDLLDQPLISFLSEKTRQSCQSALPRLRSDGDHRQELEFVCKDGQVLTMDCSCTVVDNARPSQGADDIILVLQRDITLRKQQEQERAELLATLQESERRWQSFLEKVRLLVVRLNAAGQIEYVNPAFKELMGVSPEESIGVSWFASFVPRSQKQRSQEIFQDLLQSENHPNYQSCLVTRTGEERLIAWNSTLLQDGKGQPIGTLSIGEDITERNAVDRMKNEFISVVSHELRTPLTSIHGALDLLSSGLVDPQSERGKHVFSIAVENSDRLVKLVNDILELERLESGKIKLHSSWVSAQDLLHTAYELVELMAERADIRLEMADADDLWLWADGDRLIQVLTNLMGNAIKFSETPATVWVTVEVVQDAMVEMVQFTVKDEGRGIPPENVSGIFERFHQVDASDSRRKGGTGLGLAICRSIVQQHGGEIWVDSVLGEGSCFCFTVPHQAVP